MDATPEEAYILAEMVLDTSVIDSELIWYTDANGNRQEISEAEMDAKFQYEIGGERYFLYDVEYAVLTSDGAYVVEFAGVDSATGKSFYKYKLRAGGTDYVKYNGDLTMIDPKFQIEAGSNYIDLDSFEYSFEGSMREPDNVVTEGKVYITSNKAAKYDHETGKYYAAYASGGTYYVQQAWWASDANIGTQVVPNSLSLEAKAFEQYILRVTRSRNVSEVMKKYTEHAYEIELNGTVYTGTVPAAPIEYNGRYMNKAEVANILNINETDLSSENEYGISVVFDETKNAFRIGPIVIDYVEERFQTEGRDLVEFAGIVDMTLHTNLGEVSKENWRFVFLDEYRSEGDNYGYPHEQEPFYIEMDYIEGAIEITDLHTTFRYMNAGGRYERLEGVYNKITWESKSSYTRCPGPSSHELDPETGEYPTCSHGYTVSHYTSFSAWYDITKVEPTDSQLLASGIIGARWYDPHEITLGVDISERNYSAKIPIKKELVDKSSKDVAFPMDVYINNEYDDTIWVKPNEIKYTKTYTWKEGENAPTYEIRENLEKMPEGYKFVEISNEKGTLVDNTVAPTVLVINDNDDDHEDDEGQLKIIKIAEGEDLQDKVYKFWIKIGDDVFDNVEISQATNWEWKSDIYTWEGDNAPAYEVKEYPGEGFILKSLNPSKGTLAEKNDENLVIVTAVNISDREEPKFENGSLSVTKKIDGNLSTSEEFEITAVVTEYDKDGNKSHDVTITKMVPGNTTVKIGDFTWEKGTKAPTYVITETNIPEGWELVGIDKESGSLSNGETINVTVINEATEENMGNIRVTKECITDEKMQDEAQTGEFTIEVRVTGTFEVDGESVVEGTRTYTQVLKAGESFETPNFTWYGNEAPTYVVREINIPEGWTLEGITNSSGSIQPNTTINSVVTNNFSTRIIIDLTLEMGGIVWEDGLEDTKLVEDANSEGAGKYADGLYDSSTENGIGNVEVFIEKVLYNDNGDEIGRRYASVYYEDGTPMELPIYTSVENLGRWTAPRVELGVTDAEEEQGASYARMNVRFVYDGQTYEPTKALVTGSAEDYIFASTKNRDRWKNNSMALDIDRQEVNNRVAEVYGGNEASGNKTEGYIAGTDGTVNNISYLTIPGNAEDDKNAKSEVITLHDNGVAIDVFKANATTEKAGLVYPFDERMHLLNIDKYIDEFGGVEEYHYSATYEYTKNINLGLVKRATSDLAVAKDLNKAVVVANGKMLTYRYNSILGDLSQGAKVAIESRNTVNGYQVNVYDTDYYYRAAMYEGTEAGDALNEFYNSIGKNDATASELEVYLNYRILVLNNSQGAYVAEIKEIADYFDNSLILEHSDVTAYVQTEVDGVTTDDIVTVANKPTYTLSNGGTGNVDWFETTDNIPNPTSNQKAYKTNSLSGIKLARGEYAILDMTFRVEKGTDSDGVENAIKLGDKNNTAEIARYSIYGEDGVTVEGKIDLNSAPANINFDENYFEDDTDKAPVVSIGMYETQREVNGLVFEDAQTDKLNSALGDNGYDQVVGDGIYDEDEDQVIGGVSTVLVEKVVVPTDASMQNYEEYDVVWPTDSTDIDGLGGKSIEDLTGFDSTIVTAEDGTYVFNAVPAGNFAVRYAYGKGTETATPIDETIAIYNGQDYKTTAYQPTSDASNMTEDGLLNNEWHDFTIGAENEDSDAIRYNDARDIEARRLEVISKSREIANINGEILASANTVVGNNLTEAEIQNNRQKLFDEYYMEAETAKLNLEVEDINSKDILDLLTGEADINRIGGIEISGKVIKDNPTEEENAMYDRALVYTIKNVDCGIEARSSTGIALDKQISNITLKLSDGTELVNVNFDITYEPDLQDDGTYRFKAKVKKADGSIGSEQLQSVNKVEKKFADPVKGYQNFRYLNVDEVIMQGAQVSIEYQLTALNVGEVDRIGELANAETIEDINEIIEKIKTESTVYAKGARNNEVGRYLGSVYYNGLNAKGNDGVVATKVNQVIDYIDNDAVFDPVDNMKLDYSWKTVTEKELLGEKVDGEYVNRLVSDHSFQTVEGSDELRLVDVDNKSFNTYLPDGTLQKSNVVVSLDNETEGNTFTNKGFMTETRPMGYTGADSLYQTSMKILVKRTIASESETDDMTFDNIAEILKFENEVGRRDIIATPGNANPSNAEPLAGEDPNVFGESLKERDQSATEVVTLTPPTGINIYGLMTLQVLLVVLAGLVIIAVGIVLIKKKVLTK